MSPAAAGLLTITALIGVLALVYVPFGDYMARVLTATTHGRLERRVYRVLGVDPDRGQGARGYILAVLGFGLVSIVVLVAILRLQPLLPFDRGMPAMPWDMAVNTAVSFVTNTNWQSYAGESTLGWSAQMGGLAVQNFLSAAAGIAVAAALVRAFTRTREEDLGNFWVDLVRVTLRILLPVAFVAAVLLVVLGAVQSFASDAVAQTITGAQQTITTGPVASQEAIKELGTNGGGFFNANSAHPFENPNGATNILANWAMLVIPFSMPYAFGKMVSDARQGWAVLGVMGFLWLLSVAAIIASEVTGRGAAPELAGAAMEGKEVRFGEWMTGLWAASTTGTSTGAVNGMHDSMTASGGGMALLNMMFNEVSPGGTGTGLYSMLLVAVLTVFLSGLMVGRTPEYLGKKIGGREITMVALSLLVMPATLLAGAALSVSTASGQESLSGIGNHALTQMLYAWASASNNNGSAFASLSAGTYLLNTGLGLAMLFGRFIPIALVLALAGLLARQRPTPAGAGTIPTHGVVFVSLMAFVVVVVAGLTFFPSLALGPIAEALL